ncbi:hypothetical protein BDZ85DRAFT_68971 [Elsinoe ampelina]|uniref:Uncharacterized protein n=1 Tax=Elsinoe ampelina TaxID=302913 RepID=A0A6A6GIY4_9PEZI|nr:hypothetical protein BDZ85DRAFT_68971 [Elsinoe ampelina]
MESRLPSLPWEVLYMIIDQVRCQHCQSVLSRACKSFHSHLTPRVWETLQIVELLRNEQHQHMDARGRCAESHSLRLPVPETDEHANLETPRLPGQLYDNGPQVIFPHLLVVLSTMIRTPKLRQYVKHLRIRRTYWWGKPPYPLDKKSLTDLQIIAGRNVELANGVLRAVRDAAGDSSGAQRWIRDLSIPNSGNAYLAVMLSILSGKLLSLDVLEGGALEANRPQDARTLMFEWLRYQDPGKRFDTSRFSSLERLVIRYHSEHWQSQIMKPQAPFKFISRFSNAHDLTIHGGNLQHPPRGFRFNLCPSIRRLELDSCVFEHDFTDLEVILDRLPTLVTLCIVFDRRTYVDHEDVSPIPRPTALLPDLLMDVLAIRGDTLQNLTIGLKKPEGLPWFPVDEYAEQSLKDFTKLKRLHIDDGLYSACNGDDFEFDCQLTNALPPQLEELRLMIDTEFSSRPHETMIHLLNHMKSHVPGLQRLIVDADWKWLRKNTKAVLELEELCEEQDVECIVLRNGVQGSYVPPDAPLEDLQPWQRTAARTRKDWRDLLVM